MSHEDEEVAMSEAFSARFAIGFGKDVVLPRPISDEKLAASRVKRSLGQQRKQMLAAGPQDDDAELPIPASVVHKYRTPRHFMDEALKFLDPAQVGEGFAALFMEALQKKDLHTLKFLLPYVFGQPPKAEEGSTQSGAMFGEILSVLREPPIPRKRKPKLEEIEVQSDPASPYQLPEELDE